MSLGLLQSSEQLERPKVELTGSSIKFGWKSGKAYEIPFRKLRLACPCASCVDEYTGEALLDPASVPTDISAKDVGTLGNYAVVVTWSDGHDSGIYSYKTLDKIASWDSDIQPI